MSYEKALDHLSRDDRFKATVYAMNTLLIQGNLHAERISTIVRRVGNEAPTQTIERNQAGERGFRLGRISFPD